MNKGNTEEGSRKVKKHNMCISNLMHIESPSVMLEWSLLTATLRICWLPRFPSCWIRALNSSVLSSGNCCTSFSKRDRTSERLHPAPTKTPAEKQAMCVCFFFSYVSTWVSWTKWNEKNRNLFVLAGNITVCPTRSCQNGNNKGRKPQWLAGKQQ